MGRLMLAFLTAGAVVGFLSSATTSAPFAAGTLDLRETLVVVSTPLECPPEAPARVTACRARTGTGLVPGLGSVSESYTWWYRLGPPTCTATDDGKPLATNTTLVVAGKGELHLALADGVKCVYVEAIRLEPQTFTITGGTGIYAGASGSGTVKPDISEGSGTETWTGTLIVPGVEFDVTPPVLRGATAKNVRAPRGAKSVRVTFNITALDEVDGARPVACQPRSGSRFKVGRTVVRCSATDTSGNTRIATFQVRVKAAR